MLTSLSIQLLILTGALAIGYLVVRAPLIRKSFLPTGLGAGVLLLVFGPQFGGELFSNYSLPEQYYQNWVKLPRYLIDIVFASLFIGRPIIGLKKMWRKAGPQIAFGQMLAWGQYALGGLLALLILTPIFNMPGITASLIEISFEGGHGTVAGMTPVFEQLGFETGRQLAVGLATASLLTALLSGIILINWGSRKGHFKREESFKLKRNEVYHQRILREIRENGHRVRRYLTPLRLIKHLTLVLAGVLFGWVIHSLLSYLELAIRGNNVDLVMDYLPLFTFCMFGGMIVQLICSKLKISVSRPIIELISSFALGVLIMTAVGTMSLDFIASDGFVFLILYIAGALWIWLSFLFLAKRMFSKHWFQNAIISMGQSMGMTATGLLFAQMVDKKNQTGAVESFGYKQLLFEPLMGGGIVTALSMPIILIVGLPAFTAFCVSVTLIWMLVGIIKFGNGGE